jgi:hypothetical protein
MSDPRYENIGNLDDKVIEECAELIQSIIKAKRFGLFGKHPLRPESNNLKEIQAEIRDCVKAMKKLDKYLSKVESVFIKGRQCGRTTYIYDK